jgi:hypothetical protein
LTLNSLLLTEEFSFKRKITLLSIIKVKENNRHNETRLTKIKQREK